MWMKEGCFLGFLLLLCFAFNKAATETIELTDRVPHGVVEVPGTMGTLSPVYLATVKLTSECYSNFPSFFVVSANDDPSAPGTACYSTYDIGRGSISETSCGTMGNATDVQCHSLDGDDLCAALDPVARKIYIASVNNVYMSEIDTPADPVLFHVTPSVFTGLTSVRYYYVASAETNTIIYSISSSNLTPSPVIYLNNTAKIVGLTAQGSRIIYVALEGDTVVHSYHAVDGTYLGAIGTFGSVGPLAMDSYLVLPRLYVTDYGNNKISIVDISAGWANSEINDVTGIVKVVPGRGFSLITHSTEGLIVVVNEPFTYVNTTVENATCSNGGRVTVRARGGSYSYSYSVFPLNYDLAGITYSGPNSGFQRTFTLPAVNPSIKPIYVFKDSFNPICSSSAQPDNTMAFEGNYSLSTDRQIRLECRGDIYNPVQYQLEFMVNFGLGGQMYSVKESCLDSRDPSLVDFFASDYTLGDWHKVTVQFPYKLPSPNLYICEVSDSRDPLNPIYIDNIVFTPVNDSKWISVGDSCASRDDISYTPPFTIYNGNMLTVNTSAIQPSCNNDGQNGDKSNDGLVIATATGGYTPYTYSWGISNTITNVVSNLGALDYNLVIYKNDVNPVFDDASISTGKIVRDPTVYRSAPYSFSFTPDLQGEGLAFNLVDIDTPLSGNDYYAIEMWLNGGEWGGQDLQYALMTKTQQIFARNLTQVSGLVAIPPNTWVKVTINIDNGLAFTGVHILSTLQSTNNRPQPRLYVDDVVLLHKNSRVTVTDDLGCSANYGFVSVEEPSAISLGTVVTNLQCYESQDGAVSLTPVGGTSPYHYTWSPSRAADRIITGLNESRVNIDVTDANGCYPTNRTVTVDVLQPPKIEFIVTATPAVCFGGDGHLQVSAFGGVGPYTYMWSSATTNSYSVVPQPQPFEVFTDEFSSSITLLSQSNATIYCGGTGTHLGATHQLAHSGYCSIKSNPTETSLGFQCQDCLDNRYSAVQFWIYFERPADISLHTVQFYGGNQYSTPLPLQNFNTSEAKADGWIMFEVALTMNASAFIINSQLPNLMPYWVDDIVLLPVSANLLYPGITVNTGFKSIVRGKASKYILSVTDGNLCSSSFEVDLTQPEEVVFVGDDDETEGVVDWRVIGGLPPYQYFIVGETNINVTNETVLEPGTYTIRVVDANGCATDRNLVILELKDYSRGLVIGLAVVIAIGFLVFFGAALLLALYKTKCEGKSIFYNGVLLAGVLLAFVSAIVLLPTPTDELCVSFIWLIGVGFVLVYGCLFIKTWGLYRVWRNATKYKKTNMTPLYIMKCVGAALLIEVIFLIIWTTVDPPHVIKVKMVNDTVERMCESDTPTFWIIFLSIKGVWMIVGAVMSFLTRNIMEEYNESRSIAYAIYNNVVLCIIAIPLAILLREISGGRLVIMVAVIVLAFTFTVVLVFFRIWRRVFEKDIEMANRHPNNSSRSTATGRASHYSGNSGNSGKSSHDSRSATPDSTPPRSSVSVELA